ncbi:Phosphatidylinositol-glycan biosynthesis class F protein [Morella rubra]|uniref:Phosphatidylinositol-glycan biosynthesis class F protein n=1 Tax=Morella rubra TaxID=262757 RepID=A0A6A1W0Q4_9ROSI|nr:Phosphatidylinositol-glycan biosynthesis class F protein [Morella rubra]
MKTNIATSSVKSSAEPETKLHVSAHSISVLEALVFHLIFGLVLGLAVLLAHKFYSINLVSHPSLTLRLIWFFLRVFQVIECPIVILLYSRYRKNREECSYLKAVGRGLLGLPVGRALNRGQTHGSNAENYVIQTVACLPFCYGMRGSKNTHVSKSFLEKLQRALVNALGAVALGAPVGTQYFSKTVNWSLMMSLFTIVPAAAVFGSSWKDWLRIFAHTKPMESVDFMICLPAHGAIIGAWFGAWPMPLDWERPWQEWPTCVSYGAMAGYLLALVASFSFVQAHARFQHVKRD